MMENKIKFAPNVMLIDASYLDRVTCDLQAHFAPIVNRELPKADLAVLLECLALDAGMKLGNNEIQVIFIYESGEGRLEGLTPSDLGKELHGMAFKSELGEFALYAFQPSDLATREELFIESLQLAGEFKEMQCLAAVADEDGYGNRLKEVIGEMKCRNKLTVFGMNPPAYEASHRFEMLGFAILQALGIRSEEF
jgi:hypothetical protein